MLWYHIVPVYISSSGSIYNITEGVVYKYQNDYVVFLFNVIVFPHINSH